MNIKKNLVFNILLSVSNIIFPIITFPYISRVLGPEGSGTINFALAFCQYFVLLAALGVPMYGVREIAKARESIVERSKIFVEISLIRIITTIFILIPYFIVILTVKKFESNLPLYYWGAVFIVANLGAIEWFFTGLENFKYITSRSLVVKAASVVLMFIIVKHKSDILNYFLISVFILVVNGIINYRYALKYLTFKIDWGNLFFKVHLKPLFYIFSSLMAINIYTLMDTIIMGFLSTDKAVGYYNAVMRLTKISLTIITSLATVLIPRLSYAISKQNFDDVDKLLKKSFLFVYTLGIPMMVGLFTLAPELIQLFSGKEFTPAATTLKIVSPLIFIIGMASIFSSQILTALAKDKLVMIAAIFGACVSLALNFLLIPILNENGGAISNVATELVVTVICFIYARRFIKIDLRYKDMLLSFVSTVPYLVTPMILRPYIHNSLIIISSTLVVAGFTFLIFNTFITKNELVIELLNKVRKNGKTYLQAKA